jgi:hypothetical protein
MQILFEELASKIGKDRDSDKEKGRVHLSTSLSFMKSYLKEASKEAEDAWRISKPYMMNRIRVNNLNKEEIEEFVGFSLVREIESDCAWQVGKAPPVISYMINGQKAKSGDWIIKDDDGFIVKKNSEI